MTLVTEELCGWRGGSLKCFIGVTAILRTSPNLLVERERRVRLERTFSPASLRSHTLVCVPDSNSVNQGTLRGSGHLWSLIVSYRLRDSVTVGDGGCQCCLEAEARAHL